MIDRVASHARPEGLSMKQDMKYLRHRAYKRLLQPMSARYRRLRMRALERKIGLAAGMSVLDLGGQPAIWEHVQVPLRITILNLPNVAHRTALSQHALTYVDGDACEVTQFGSREFDLVFSNSVIEHVGPLQRQRAFADEVRRLGKAYWVQTPSIWFPLEAHTGMPFWWFYPPPLKQAVLRGWREKLPGWTEMIEGTTVISLATLRDLFPEGNIEIERIAGVPKSYSVYHLGA